MASTGQFNVVCSGKLTVQLHRTGVLGMFRRPIAADCLHFSISGIQVETPAQLKVGQPVVMDLIVNDLRVEELSGVVRSASAADDKHYYDIDFRMEGRDAREYTALPSSHRHTRPPTVEPGGLSCELRACRDRLAIPVSLSTYAGRRAQRRRHVAAVGSCRGSRRDCVAAAMPSMPHLQPPSR